MQQLGTTSRRVNLQLSRLCLLRWPVISTTTLRWSLAVLPLASPFVRTGARANEIVNDILPQLNEIVGLAVGREVQIEWPKPLEALDALGMEEEEQTFEENDGDQGGRNEDRSE